MTFCFRYTVSAKELWILYMHQIYKAWTGIVNVVFTVTMILLTVRFWSSESILRDALMICACLFFPVFHPLIMYSRARKQAQSIPADMEIAVDSSGMRIHTPAKTQTVQWSQIHAMKPVGSAIVLVTGQAGGYIFTDRLLGHQKQDFIMFLSKHIR